MTELCSGLLLVVVLEVYVLSSLCVCVCVCVCVCACVRVCVHTCVCMGGGGYACLSGCLSSLFILFLSHTQHVYTSLYMVGSQFVLVFMYNACSDVNLR